MAENITLAPINTLQNSSIIATVNANNAIITNAFLDCVSLAGNLPNSMQSNFDMNSFQIINLPAPGTGNSPIRLIDLENAVTGNFGANIFGLLNGVNTWTNVNTFTNTTQSTSVTTGAVILSGGLGVAKNLNVGGNLAISGSFVSATLSGGTSAASTLTLQSTTNVSPSGDSLSVEASTFFFKSTTGGTTFGDYNHTHTNAWNFAANVFINGSLIDTSGNITAPTIVGGTSTGSTLTLQSTSNGTPSGDSISIEATTVSFKSATGGSTFGTVTSTGLNSFPIGATTASTGAFTTLSASSTVSGTGFSTYLASPPAIGGTAPAAGSFTTLLASSTLRTSSAGTSGSVGSAATPSLQVGNAGTGFFSVSTTGVGITANTVSVADYNISNASDWTLAGSLILTGGILALAGVSSLSRSNSTGALTINSNIAAGSNGIIFTPSGVTALSLSSTAATFSSTIPVSVTNTTGASTSTTGAITCAGGISATGNIWSGANVVGIGVYADGDGGGFAGFNGITNVTAAVGTNVGTLGMNATGRKNDLWAKFWIGSASYWFPIWTGQMTNTPP